MTGFRKFRKFAAAAALALLLPAIALQIAFAADPELLGYAALLDEPQVALRLQLSDEQKEQAATLLNERRNVTVKAALEMRDLSEKEQYAKLAPLIAESEKLARDLLDDRQKAEFDRIRIGRDGPVALAEPSMAAQFAITEEQRKQIDALVAERTAAVADAESPEVKAIEATFDQRLLAVLNDEQRKAWTDYVQVAEAAGVDPADETAPSEGPAVAEGSMPLPGSTRPSAVPLPRIPQPGETGGDVVGTGDVQERLENVRLRLSFSDTPWGSVVEWLARQAHLSLIMDAPPEGTLDYSSPEEKTLGQTLDFFNQLLQTKGYRLLLKDRLLILVNLADPIPPTLIDTVAPEDLESRGRYELLRTTFKVRSLPVEEAAQAVAALVAPDGTYIALPTGQIVVTATGAKLIDVRHYLEDAEGTGGGFVSVPLENRIADELMPTIRTLFGIAEDAWATPDDSLRIAIDPTGTRFLISGSPRSIERFQSFVKAIDVPDTVAAGAAGADVAYFDTYPAGSEPQLAFQVMQTMLAGIPDVRIALNEGNGTIVLLGRPAQHQTVKDALGVMTKDARQVEVIRLRYVDPSQALQAINLLFGNPTPAAPVSTTPGAPAAAAPAASSSAPIVAADTLTGMLFIRGSRDQIDQIKDLLSKMGELESDDPYASDRGNIRLIPLKGRAAQEALSNLTAIWPTVRENRIRIVTPSELAGDREVGGLIEERRASNGSASGAGTAPSQPGAAAPDNPLGLSPEQLLELEALGVDPSIFLDSGNFPNPDATPLPVEPAPRAPRPEPAPLPNAPRSDEPDASIQVPAEDREASTSQPGGVFAKFVSLQEEEQSIESDAGSPVPGADPEQPSQAGQDPEVPGAERNPDASDAARSNQPPTEQPVDDGPPGDVVLSVTPNGIVAASKDTRVLDEVEDFLNQVITQNPNLGPQFTIFYLKHVTASGAKQLLEQALTGESEPADGGGGGLLGDIASSAMADVGGGLLGGILGGSGASVASGDFVIIPDDRLNYLLVQANPEDLELIEDLLTIIDRERSPEEVLTGGTPRVVKLVNLKAPAVVEIVKSTYADRIEQQGGQGGQGGPGGRGGPSPEDLLRAITGGGGRGGRGGQGGGGSAPEPAKMTVSPDEASNSVIVRAPEPLLGEVVQFIKDLDAGAQAETSETMQVLTLKNLSSSSIQASLESILGDQATIGSSGPAGDGDNGVGGQSRQSGSSGDSNRSSSNNNNSSADDAARDAQRRAFFDALRNGGVGGRPGSGGGPPQGGPGGGPGGGFRFPGGGGGSGRGR